MVRATPMPAAERRATLIAVTEPLLQEFGRGVSTRQIAEAAEVAEGTIFRVFPTKETLIEAVFAEALNVDPLIAALGAIEESALEPRLVSAVTLLQNRLRRVFGLFHAFRQDRPMLADHQQHQAKHQLDNERITQALVHLIEPHTGQLRLPPIDVAQILRTTTFAYTHPWIREQRSFDPTEIVDVVLYGVAGTEDARPC